jgi:hypothetical protein
MSPLEAVMKETSERILSRFDHYYHNTTNIYADLISRSLVDCLQKTRIFWNFQRLHYPEFPEVE